MSETEKSEEKPENAKKTGSSWRPWIILGAIGGGVVMVFFAVVMYSMASNMARMTDVIVGMGRDMKSMAKDMHSMHITMVDLDESVDQMTTEMKLIEGLMAEDMDAMRVSIQAMTGDIRNMSFRITSMNGQMGQMTYDIHRGQRAFTSPWGYAESMMSPQY